MGLCDEGGSGSLDREQTHAWSDGPGWVVDQDEHPYSEWGDWVKSADAFFDEGVAKFDFDIDVTGTSVPFCRGEGELAEKILWFWGVRDRLGREWGCSAYLKRAYV